MLVITREKTIFALWFMTKRSQIFLTSYWFLNIKLQTANTLTFFKNWKQKLCLFWSAPVSICFYNIILTLSQLSFLEYRYRGNAPARFSEKQTSFPLLLLREKSKQALIPSGNPGLTSRDKYKNHAVPEVINTVCNYCLQSFWYAEHWPLSLCFLFLMCNLWSKIKQYQAKRGVMSSRTG